MNPARWWRSLDWFQKFDVVVITGAVLAFAAGVLALWKCGG